MRRGALDALDHVIVGVRDLEAASASYAALLGRSPSWRGVHPEQGTENTLFRLSNTYLELLSPLAGEQGGWAAAALARRFDERGEGLVGLAFGTGDAAAFAEHLRGAGVDVDAPTEGGGRHRDGLAERSWRTVRLPPAATRGVLVFAIEHRGGALPEAPVAAPAGTAVDGLDHVVVTTARADESRRVYEDVLGLRLALDRGFEERRVRLLFFRVGGVTVEVAGSLDEVGAASGADHLWGLAYKVADVDAARRRLAAGGFDVTEARRGHKQGTRVFTVRSGTNGVATLVIGPEPEDG